MKEHSPTFYVVSTAALDEKFEVGISSFTRQNQTLNVGFSRHILNNPTTPGQSK